MSLSYDIKSKILELDGSKLHFFEALDSATAVRHLVVSTEVRNAIYPPYPKGREDRHAEFLDALDLWVEGGIFTVSDSPDDHPRHTMLARTRPVGAGIWDIRCVDVDHGIRCLGAFGGKDIFVALMWEYREEIADFDACVMECRATWDALFFPLPPFSGGSIDDYLTSFKVLKETRRRRTDSGRS